MPKRNHRSRPREFVSKAFKPTQDARPPRIILIGEGHMEVNALTDLARNIVAWKNIKIQPINSSYRIRAGGTVPYTAIAKSFRKLVDYIFIRGEAEAVCGLIDHEDRLEEWDDFINCCRNHLNNVGNNKKPYVLCVASRATEAWMLGDVERAAEAVRPSNNPRQNRYQRVETISHPVDQEMKKYWPHYKKTKHGAEILRSIRPEIVAQHSDSFSDFVARIEWLNSEADKRS